MEKSIVISREDLVGNEQQQKEAAQTITNFLEALPKSSAWGYTNKRVIVGIKDFANNIHLGWVDNNEFFNLKSHFKQLYILSYELKTRETLEGKNVKTIIYQEETDDGERRFLYQNRICYFRRNFKEDPDMFEEGAIGHKTWLYCGRNMFDRFVEQSKVPPIFDHVTKQLFNDLLSGKIKELGDLSSLPSKEEGEKILAEAEKKRAEEARKRDLEELNVELKGLPEYIKDLSSKQFKKAFNIISYRYHAYSFKDAYGFERLSEKEIRMHLTKKMWFVCDSVKTKLYYKDEDLEIGITCESSLDLSQAKTTDLKELFDEIHDIFEYRFPNILNRDLFLKYVLKDFHKYFHGMSAW